MSNVQKGDKIISFDSVDWFAKFESAKIRASTAAHVAEFSQLSQDQKSKLLVLQQEAEIAIAEATVMAEEIRRFQPIAPFAGVLTLSNPELSVNEWVSAGEQIAVLSDYDKYAIWAYLDEDDVKHVNIGDSGIFISDGLGGGVISIKVLLIDADATKALPAAFYASQFGGGVLARVVNGQYVPERAVYRVVFEAVSPLGELRGRTWRGSVTIRSGVRSIAGRYFRNATSILLREFGF